MDVALELEAQQTARRQRAGRRGGCGGIGGTVSRDPIAAFFIGGYGGFVATRQVFDDGVLGWLIPLVVGLGLAIGLALVSYFLWYAGALILSGAVGALLGSGLMAALDIETNWVVVLVSLAGAALGALIAYFFNLP